MQTLTAQQIQEIALGVVYMTETEKGVFLHRFTAAQEEAYRKTNDEFYMKTSSSAGIRLKFETDAQTMELAVSLSKGSKSNRFAIDVYADDAFVGSIDNLAVRDGIEGDFEAAFDLGKGTKTVCVYMPWAACVKIAALRLNTDAFVRAVKPAKKMICFGDSITQGLTTLRARNCYTTRLAELMDAEIRNKGIGGDTFFPPLAQCDTEADFAPDYITVAYGTNDWGKKSQAAFLSDVRAFYGALSEMYPQAKIFAVTPIWRADENDERPFGPFGDVEKRIFEGVEGLGNVTVISGYELVPHAPACFEDLRLHPNEDGFAHYAKNLYSEIQKYL